MESFEPASIFPHRHYLAGAFADVPPRRPARRLTREFKRRSKNFSYLSPLVGREPSSSSCDDRQNVSFADTIRNRGLLLNCVSQDANAGLPGMNGLAENPVNVLRANTSLILPRVYWGWFNALYMSPRSWTP